MDRFVIPSRFEPLQAALGEQVPLVLVRVEEDLTLFARMAVSIKTAHQGKLLFLFGEPGSGKSTCAFSLPVFLPEYYAAQHRVPPPYELPHERIPAYVAQIPRKSGITVVTVDRRENPDIDEQVFRSMFMQLNGLLRDRPDLLIVWPLTDEGFARHAVHALSQFGGQSAFSASPVATLRGVPQDKFITVLERMLNVAGWDLADASVTWQEVEEIARRSTNIGAFLHEVHVLVTERTNLEQLGIHLPRLVFVMSSDGPIQEVCRGLRRADTYFVESARLLMETRESNVAEWWRARQTDPQSALPFVVASFQTQLVSLSPSAVVYAAGLYGDEFLRNLAVGPQQNRGNARSALKSTEFYRLFAGERDVRRWGGQQPSVKTREAYKRIQSVSREAHKEINRAIIALGVDAGMRLDNPAFEQQLSRGSLQTDVVCGFDRELIALEFHHKAEHECTPNKVAIYVLEKLREYAVDFGLAVR